MFNPVLQYIRRCFVLLALLLFIPLSLLAQRYTVSGTVLERGSRETLIGATVSVVGQAVGTATNAYGFYAITLPAADSVVLEFSYVGYATQRHTVAWQRSQMLNVELDPMPHDIDEVVVVKAEGRTSSRSTQTSVVELPMQQLKAIPAVRGEKDVLKAMQLMPGVQSGGEGTSGIYVRGGSPDQNLIILDDATVYNASHQFGQFSLFNGDAIKSVELLKGGFPARYGGRLASVMDISMKDGSKQNYAGEAGIGLLSSRLVFEGPIVRDKASFIVSGRRTYMDLPLRLMMATSNGMQVGTYFYDLTAKANWEVNARNKLYLSGYFGRDKFFVRDKSDGHSADIGMFWGNATGTLRWNHIFSERLFANLSAIFSNYRFNVYANERGGSAEGSFDMNYLSGIRDYGLKFDFTWYPAPAHTLRFGAAATLHQFSPVAMVMRADAVGVDYDNKVRYSNLEMAAYAEDEMRLGQWGLLNVGARLVAHRLNLSSFRAHIEPRAALTVYLTDQMSLKSSYAVMNQYMHLLSNTGVGQPTDLWVPATERVPSQRRWQTAFGCSYDLPQWRTTLSLEGYYKRSNGVLSYRPGANFMNFDINNGSTSGGVIDWEQNVTSGRGRAYGVELLAHRKSGRLQGWVGYTIAWIKHQFEEINNGREFFPNHDRRHDISVVAMFDITERIKLSATWVYSSGNYVTIPLASYTAVRHDGHSAWQRLYDYGSPNTMRMAAYHRLDVGVQFVRKKRKTIRTWDVGLYNAYCRANPYYYYVGHDDSGNITLRQVSMFPIMPSVSWSIKF